MWRDGHMEWLRTPVEQLRDIRRVEIMREIKFRGKRLDNGEWVHGYYVFYGFVDNQKHYIVPDYASALYVFEVDPSTVGQYTGVKDKNGREIYEGDIVTNGVSIGVVVWHDVRAMFIIDGSQCDITPMDDWCELKRIGTMVGVRK